jgi:hypothetical protein
MPCLRFVPDRQGVFGVQPQCFRERVRPGATAVWLTVALSRPLASPPYQVDGVFTPLSAVRLEPNLVNGI